MSAKSLLLMGWVGVGFLSPVCLGQAPLLELSQPARGATAWQVTIRNSYSSDATAFVLSMTSPDHPLRGGAPLARHFEDEIPSPRSSGLGLAAGSSRIMHLGGARLSAVAYTVEAVIYRDGATAGNPEAIRQILRVRQFEMADIAAALPLLARARADTELAAHLPLLVNEFRARENTHLDQLRSRPLHMVAVDPICELVIANLGGAGPSQSLSDLVATIGITLQQWADQLGSSLPPTATAGGS